ncbi:MAG: hypothetical protein KDJ28_11940 [Candidatus Competibacteraceae bacterium]|nr:hypothetical protein [Candidatus Competibacteraceae bacterium]
MHILLTLGLWLALLGLAVRWPKIGRHRAWMLVLLGVLAIIGGSRFWQGILHAAWSGDELYLLEPAAAFASVWLLVLPSLWQRRLDRTRLVASLFTGLVAMAAIGTALDLGHLVFSRFSLGAGSLAIVLMISIIAALVLTGFTLDRWISDEYFPWEYAAWCAGLLVIVQPAHPVLLQINPAGEHGLWTLAVLLAMIGCLAQSQRSHSSLIWIGGALVIPVSVGFAVGG